MFDSALYCAISKRYALTILFQAPAFMCVYTHTHKHTHACTHAHTNTHTQWYLG